MDRTAITSRWIVCVAAICSLAGISHGVEFAGGTGEPNDPYQIATAEQLIAISSDGSLFDKHFVLTADIDLDPSLPGRVIFRQAVVEWVVNRPFVTRRAVGEQGISIAASGDTSLQGSFDGDGHVIRNCMIVSTTGAFQAGFFGEIASQGVVRNLYIEGMTVADVGNAGTTNFYSGLLAAVNYGTVLNCSATGTLSTYAGGGLVGQNAGLVVGCRSSCDVFGSAVGGLIGQNEAAGRVLLSEFDGILFSDYVAGGLVGTNLGTVQFCKSSGFASAGQIGGLVGQNIGSVRECCVTGTVESGGGVAYNNGGTIVNCYSTGTILGSSVDGLAVVNTGTILSSYSTTTSRARSTTATRRSPGSEAADSGESAAGISILAEAVIRYVYYLNPNKQDSSIDSPLLNYGVALSPDQMTQASSFIGFDFYGDANDGPAGHWFMPPQGYPVLTWQAEITGLVGVPEVSDLSPEQAKMVLDAFGFASDIVRYDYARPPVPRTETKGQVISPYPLGYLPPDSPVGLLVSLGQYDFRLNPGDGSAERPYRIETAGQLDALRDESGLWGKHFELTADIDLTGYASSGPLIETFSGEFNGNGHVIRNLQSDSGLFGTVKFGASVHDLIVDRVYLSQVTVPAIGVLAGLNEGQILRCQVAGQVVGGYSDVGGLVSYNVGRLEDCSFHGTVQALVDSRYVGGVVGTNAGSISRCGAHDVEVSGASYVGGLAGLNNSSASIEACYATGTVQGGSAIGGLVGRQGTVTTATRRSVLTQDQIAIAADPLMGPVIRDCYAACSVKGLGDVGGCIGSMSESNASLESCFFLASEDGGGPDNGYGTPLTDAQMKQQASFTGWDFDSTWTICEGVSYPRLWWEEVDCGAVSQAQSR